MALFAVVIHFTGPNGVLFKIGRGSKLPGPLPPNDARGHLLNIFGLLAIKAGH